MAKIYRQGDCVVKESKKELGVHITVGTSTSVRGETGHEHTVHGKVVRTASGQQLVQVEEKGEITHDEHPRIELTSGTYEVNRIRDFQPQTNRYD